MDALITFGNHGTYSQQPRTLGCPVARGAGAVFLSGKNHERSLTLGILFAGVEDAHLLAFGKQAGYAAFGSRSEFVAQPNVGECPADHDFMVAATRAIGVKVGWLDAVFRQILPRRAV